MVRALSLGLRIPPMPGIGWRKYAILGRSNTGGGQRHVDTDDRFSGRRSTDFGAAQLATFAGSVTVIGASVITAGVIGTTAGSLVLNSATATSQAVMSLRQWE